MSKFRFFRNPNKDYVNVLCSDLLKAGYKFEKSDIQKYVKSINPNKVYLIYIPEVSMESHKEVLLEQGLIKVDLHKMIKKTLSKIDDNNNQINKNSQLSLLNLSMLTSSDSDCEKLNEDSATKDGSVLEDLYFSLFYERRKLQELIVRIDLIKDRIKLYETSIELKILLNKYIEEFEKEFNETCNFKESTYEYELNALEKLKGKKYSSEEIEEDGDILDKSKEEKEYLVKERDVQMKKVSQIRISIEDRESEVESDCDNALKEDVSAIKNSVIRKRILNKTI